MDPFQTKFHICFGQKISDPKKTELLLKCKSSHLAILINIWHIWEDRSQKVNMNEPDLSFFHWNFWPVISQAVRKPCPEGCQDLGSRILVPRSWYQFWCSVFGGMGQPELFSHLFEVRWPKSNNFNITFSLFWRVSSGGGSRKFFWIFGPSMSLWGVRRGWKIAPIFLEAPNLWVRCSRLFFVSREIAPIFPEAPNLWVRCCSVSPANPPVAMYAGW